MVYNSKRHELMPRAICESADSVRLKLNVFEVGLNDSNVW